MRIKPADCAAVKAAMTSFHPRLECRSQRWQRVSQTKLPSSMSEMRVGMSTKGNFGMQNLLVTQGVDGIERDANEAAERTERDAFLAKKIKPPASGERGEEEDEQDFLQHCGGIV